MGENSQMRLTGRLAEMVIRQRREPVTDDECDPSPFDDLITPPEQIINDLLARRQGRKLVESSNDAVRTTALMITAGLAGRVVSSIHGAIASCETPIEELMLCALLVTAANRRENIYLVVRSDPLGDWETGYVEMTGVFSGHKPNVRIVVQPSIGTYQVDFLVERHSWIGEQDRQFSAHVIVECDGHEHHERTKQQVSGDKRTDRALQTLGFRVFRFTCSDLWADAIKYADEVWHLLETDEKKSQGYIETTDANHIHFGRSNRDPFAS